MKRFESVGLLHIAALLATVLTAYLPQLYEFVGTDIGVYYEIGRRLATDGRLELWGNYWDHKPPLIYLYFAIFSHLDALLGDTSGLKLGALCAYSGLTLLAYRALSIARPTDSRTLAALGSAAATSLVLGWLDPVANGILMVSALICAFSGLVLCADGKRDTTVFLGGALIGLAPFLRPTALTALPFMLTLLFLEYRKTGERRRLWLALSGAVMVAGGCALWLLTFGGSAVFDSLIHYNADYGSRARSTTAVADFFFQDPIALCLAGVLLTSGVASLSCATSPHRSISLVLWAWALTEVASIVFQRKIQSFYLFGFILPLLLAFTYSALNATQTFRTIAAVLLSTILAGTLGYSAHKLDLRILQNPLVSQHTQKTNAIAQIMSAQNCKGVPNDVLVYGNRAQIYTHAAAVGIRPYSWTVFLNPVVDGSLFADRQRQLVDSLTANPASFIVYVGGDGWSPNIGGRIEKIEALIKQRYTAIPVAQTGGLETPYNYQYRLYRKAECAEQ